MKFLAVIFPLLVVTMCCIGQSINSSTSQRLTGSDLTVSLVDAHFLAVESGQPFFWLADTGWELVHRLKRNEITFYFKTREKQGFTVIQTVAIAEFDGLTEPNAYGDLPLKATSDPTQFDTTPGNIFGSKLEYDYWDHLDFIISEAQRHNLHIALLPCWGEYVIPRDGKNIIVTPKQAYSFGRFFGNRYRNARNIIWILGGDRLPDEIKEGVVLWRLMARGIIDGINQVKDTTGIPDFRSTLMSYHCSESSSRWFQQDSWLDFNMWGSYHSNFSLSKAFEQPQHDYILSPIKPTLNAEPAYEEHPVNWLEGQGNFVAYDVRQIAYWSVFAGAFGHTYGCNSVWQFFDKGKNSTYQATKSWKKALFNEGADQMQFLKKLMLSRPFFLRKPANDIILEGQGHGPEHNIATLGEGFAFVYLPTGHPVRCDLRAISKSKVKTWWFNPRNGESLAIGDFGIGDSIIFTPPGISKNLPWLKNGRGCDWVLVLDDVTLNYKPPGR